MNPLMILTLLNEHRPMVGMLMSVGTLNQRCPVSVRHTPMFSANQEDLDD